MNYEKLTLDRFALNLKEGKYVGVTGARRGIGKTDWSQKDKDRGRAMADAHFGEDADASATPKAKKAAKTPHKATKTVAKRTPRTATENHTSAATKPARHPVESSSAPILPRLMGDDANTVRQHAASTVIAAFRNAGPLNANERRAYDLATAQYSESVGEDARRVVATLYPQGEGQVSVPARIALPRPVVDETKLSPEDRAQHEALKKAADRVGFPHPPTAAS